jgi:hypothetical protein
LWEASGSNGRVYQVREDASGRTISTTLDFPERQVLFIDLGDGGAPLIGTGDAAALYRVGATAKDAVYLSKSLDAQWAARWGKLHFGGTGVELSTRTGNTQKPDATWSAWQTLAGTEARPEGGVGRVQSPGGRFLQIRAHLAGTKSVLRELTAYYLPQNQRARVSEVTVGDEPSGTHHLLSLQKAPHAHSAVLHVRWKVENPDDDELDYRAYFREEADPTWHLIGGPDPLTKAEVDWNTEALPDGHYLVRVVASDEKANAKDDALESELTSAPALVDNKRPEVGPIEVSTPPVKKGVAAVAVASGRAKDSASPITELAYSVDGGDFVAASAKDGVFDDLEESFSIRLPGLSPGTHTLAVRAVDSAENLGAAQLSFRVK